NDLFLEDDVMRARIILVSTLLITACSELPTAAPRTESDADYATARLAVPPPPTCTKRWANGASGFWADSTAWSPAGVPGVLDHVSLAAAGSSDSTANVPILVRSLGIGGPGADVDFLFAAPAGISLTAILRLEVASGSTLTFLAKAGSVLSTG